MKRKKAIKIINKAGDLLDLSDGTGSKVDMARERLAPLRAELTEPEVRAIITALVCCRGLLKYDDEGSAEGFAAHLLSFNRIVNSIYDDMESGRKAGDDDAAQG